MALDDLKSSAVEAVLLLQGKINDEDDETVTMWLLVPSKVIGSIIGKSGSIINEIRKRTKAVSFLRTYTFYPLFLQFLYQYQFMSHFSLSLFDHFNVGNFFYRDRVFSFHFQPCKEDLALVGGDGNMWPLLLLFFIAVVGGIIAVTSMEECSDAWNFGDAAYLLIIFAGLVDESQNHLPDILCVVQVKLFLVDLVGKFVLIKF